MEGAAMNRNENIEKGEFFKFQATVTRRNGKFYIVTWCGVRGVQGSGGTNRLKDNSINLFRIKDELLSSLKIHFEIDFERRVFQEKSKEQLKKITKKTCYEEHLLTNTDWAEASICRDQKDMEVMLSRAELLKKTLR
jgi:hypothetical protein